MSRFRQLRCSFCCKSESQVEKLVAGPRAYTGARVYICDACVGIANEIMNAPQGGGDNRPTVQLSPWRKLSDRVRHFINFGHQKRIAEPVTGS